MQELHPSEQALIEYIRELRYGTFTLKVEHGLPERGEEVRAKVVFNSRNGGGK